MMHLGGLMEGELGSRSVGGLFHLAGELGESAGMSEGAMAMLGGVGAAAAAGTYAVKLLYDMEMKERERRKREEEKLQEDHRKMIASFGSRGVVGAKISFSIEKLAAKEAAAEQAEADELQSIYAPADSEFSATADWGQGPAEHAKKIKAKMAAPRRRMEDLLQGQDTPLWQAVYAAYGGGEEFNERAAGMANAAYLAAKDKSTKVGVLLSQQKEDIARGQALERRMFHDAQQPQDN
jgi:hypothetical protein